MQRIIAIAALLLLACGSTHASDVRFVQLDEEIQDTPIKTQIQQNVLVSGEPTASGVRAELERRFQRARQRSGFRHHRQATNIYIYIYGSREQAAAGQGLWVGMVSWTSHTSSMPRYQVDKGRLAAMGGEPEERGGFTESERRNIFRQIVTAEDRAREEAMRRVPDSRWQEQLDLERRLQARYRQEVLDRWEISDDQARKISIEALEKGWPLP